MRLKYDNISHIAVLTYYGIIYSVYVAMKSHRVSDSRHYCSADERGRTAIEAFNMDLLPKCIKDYLSNHKGEVRYESPDGFVELIYKG